MSQLTQTAYYARKFIKFFLIGLLAIIILVPSVKAFGQYWRKTHPEPPPPPNAAFGKIPSPKFGSPNYPAEGLSFQLQTAEGNLPNLGTQARVYFVTILDSKFFDEEKTRRKAASLGFNQEIGKIGATRLAFNSSQTNATLKMDIINNNFEISYPYQNNLFFISQPGPDQSQALKNVQNILSQAEMWSEDIDPQKTHFILLKYDQASQKFVIANSLSESQLIKVNLRRADLDSLPIMPPSPDESNISFIVSSEPGGSRVIFGKHILYPISYEKWGTYPIKSSVTAWEQLQSGQGFIARLGNNSPKNPIIIRSIYLAYFDPESPQSFLQPIFVFEGYNDFLAYLPALDPSYLE
jgi:hypothetical protein